MSAYLLTKYMGEVLQKWQLSFIKEGIYLLFFVLGVRYSMEFVAKRYVVADKRAFFIYSVWAFAFLVAVAAYTNIAASQELFGALYGACFYGVVFLLYYFLTKRWLDLLDSEV